MKPAVGGGTAGFNEPKQYYAVFSVINPYPIFRSPALIEVKWMTFSDAGDAAG
jgi:hypothetical protein